MNTEHLVTMINQIAATFEEWPDRNDACQEVVTHLKRFWDPRMRRQLTEHADRTNGADLSLLALQAIRLLG